MDMRKLLFSALSAFSCLSLVFSSLFQGLDADAAMISVELTPAETLALYGSSIDAYYCAYQNDYRKTSFNYVGAVTGLFNESFSNQTNPAGNEAWSVLSSAAVASSYTYLVYSCADVAYSDSSNNIEFQLQLQPSIKINCQQFIGSMFFSVPAERSNISNYSPSWNWKYNDETVSFYANRTASGAYSGLNYFNVFPNMFTVGNVSNSETIYFRGIPVYFSDEEERFTISSSDVTLFRSIMLDLDGADYPAYYILLQCPILSDGYTSGSGGSGSGGGTFNPEIVIANGYFDVDGNIELEIDLSQIIELLDYIAHRDGYDQMDDLVDAVNGVKDSVDDLKGSLADLIADAKESTKEAIDEGLSEGGPLSWIGSALSNLGQSILDGISSFFIPDDDAFQGFSDDISSSFDSHLGGISELGSLLDEQFRYIYDATSVDTIYLGEIHAPVEFDSNGNGITYFDIGGYDVELKPEEEKLHVLYDALYYMIDLTAVSMVLNMLKTKREVIYNPEGECISYDN